MHFFLFSFVSKIYILLFSNSDCGWGAGLWTFSIISNKMSANLLLFNTVFNEFCSGGFLYVF